MTLSDTVNVCVCVRVSECAVIKCASLDDNCHQVKANALMESSLSVQLFISQLIKGNEQETFNTCSKCEREFER